MLKINTLVGVCVLLAGCVIYSPTYVSDSRQNVVRQETTSKLDVDVVNSSTEKQTKEVSERVITKVARPRVQHTLAECSPFVLPRGVTKPKYLTDSEIAAVEDSPALDRLLGSKIKELQTYINQLPSVYEQAHAQWMEECAKKLLN